MRPVPWQSVIAEVDVCCKPVSTVTRQRVLIFRGSILTIEPSLVPILRVTVKFGMREVNILPFLNGDATKFRIGPVYEFSMTV